MVDLGRPASAGASPRRARRPGGSENAGLHELGPSRWSTLTGDGAHGAALPRACPTCPTAASAGSNAARRTWLQAPGALPRGRPGACHTPPRRPPRASPLPRGLHRSSAAALPGTQQPGRRQARPAPGPSPRPLDSRSTRSPSRFHRSSRASSRRPGGEEAAPIDRPRRRRPEGVQPTHSRPLPHHDIDPMRNGIAWRQLRPLRLRDALVPRWCAATIARPVSSGRVALPELQRPSEPDARRQHHHGPRSARRGTRPISQPQRRAARPRCRPGGRPAASAEGWPAARSPAPGHRLPRRVRPPIRVRDQHLAPLSSRSSPRSASTGVSSRPRPAWTSATPRPRTTCRRSTSASAPSPCRTPSCSWGGSPCQIGHGASIGSPSRCPDHCDRVRPGSALGTSSPHRRTLLPAPK